MSEKETISISIKEIKDRWINYCVNTLQHRAKTKDYKDLQYIDKLVMNGLDNDTINDRLKRYRKIRITDESLNEKRKEFNKRMSKPSKRIELSKRGKSYLHHFGEELEDNPYYNQKLVWCNECGRTHRINTDVACNHSVKPIPIKCEVNEDHCWNMKDIRQKKIFGINISDHDYMDTGLFIIHREGVVEECIVCDKKGLRELSFIGEDLRVNKVKEQFKEVSKYIQSIKSMEFEKLEKMTHNTFGDGSGGIIIQIPEFNKKIREIQNIQDYIII